MNRSSRLAVAALELGGLITATTPACADSSVKTKPFNLVSYSGWSPALNGIVTNALSQGAGVPGSLNIANTHVALTTSCPNGTAGARLTEFIVTMDVSRNDDHTLSTHAWLDYKFAFFSSQQPMQAVGVINTPGALGRTSVQMTADNIKGGDTFMHAEGIGQGGYDFYATIIPFKSVFPDSVRFNWKHLPLSAEASRHDAEATNYLIFHETSVRKWMESAKLFLLANPCDAKAAAQLGDALGLKPEFKFIPDGVAARATLGSAQRAVALFHK